jgi:hypothetical protein
MDAARRSVDIEAVFERWLGKFATETEALLDRLLVSDPADALRVVPAIAGCNAPFEPLKLSILIYGDSTGTPR